MNLKLIVPPCREPVGVEEAKRYLRIETAEEQEIIENLITAARLAVESYTGKALMTQTWRLTLSSTSSLIKQGLTSALGSQKMTIKLPGNPFIYLQGAPKLITQEGSHDIKNYHVVKGCSQALLGINGLCLKETQTLQVDFVCGYGDSPTDIPLTFQQAILMLVAELYENRNGQSSQGLKPAFINDSVACLLAPFRCISVS